MPGVGKSYLGRLVASAMSLPFVDLDEQIETYLKNTIQSHIATKGIEFFRISEAISLRKLDLTLPSIISVGGGCPCFHDNLNYMNLVGKSIYLDIPIDDLLTRYEAMQLERPLMTTDSTTYLTSTYQTRIVDYARANHTVPISSNTEQNVDNIISAIKSLCY